MIQPDGAGVGLTCTESCKIRMLFLEAGDGRNVVGLAVTRAQVGMTLSTRPVRRGLQERRTLVFDVAGCTFGSECLIGVVRWRVMADEASSVSHARGEGSSLSYMTERALLREDGMRTRELAARIHFLAALRALREKPG